MIEYNELVVIPCQDRTNENDNEVELLHCHDLQLQSLNSQTMSPWIDIDQNWNLVNFAAILWRFGASRFVLSVPPILYIPTDSRSRTRHQRLHIPGVVRSRKYSLEELMQLATWSPMSEVLRTDRKGCRWSRHQKVSTEVAGSEDGWG
jgi:hypothetical protein